jgi:hypothetical protein
MALPELIKKKVEVALDNFSEKFIPQHVRDKVRLNYSFRGETVSLFEERPYFQDPAQWTSTPIAQFRFNSDDKTWSLYCADRNSKWHLYDRAKPSRQFNHLLRAVEHDPTGIFWG